MFIFLSGQVGWRVIPDFLGHGFDVGGRVSKNFSCMSVDDNCVM